MDGIHKGQFRWSKARQTTGSWYRDQLGLRDGSFDAEAKPFVTWAQLELHCADCQPATDSDGHGHFMGQMWMCRGLWNLWRFVWKKCGSTSPWLTLTYFSHFLVIRDSPYTVADFSSFSDVQLIVQVGKLPVPFRMLKLQRVRLRKPQRRRPWAPLSHQNPWADGGNDGWTSTEVFNFVVFNWDWFWIIHAEED